MADQADIERFMSYVDILPNGCWFWTGARSRGRGNKKWYGSFWIGGRAVRAHRFACDEIGKMPPLPKGWHRDHTCCFSLCVNFRHLEYVTHETNQQRKMERKDESVRSSGVGLAQSRAGSREELNRPKA
jgi:hypothetical protein